MSFRIPIRRLSAACCTFAIAGALVGSATSARGVPAPCEDPPEVFPLDEVERGLTATGWTVVEGTEPVSFDVEVLGVQPDAIAPGFDVIVVTVSGPVIDRTDGIAAGFSGSPVYVGGQLLGSLSWSTPDPLYGALTPGAMIVDLFGYPTGRTATPTSFALDGVMRRAIARAAGTDLAEVASTMSSIPVSLGLSGVSAERVDEVASRFAHRGVTVVPFTTGSTSASASIAEAAPFEPGDAFTAAVAYGSVTYAGIGTVTATCGDDLVAFGHSFTHSGGRRTSAAMEAEIITVVPQGGFKLANVGVLRGVVDQDRLAGVRAIEGVRPPQMTTITARAVNTGLGTNLRTTTRVTDPSWLKDVAYDHTSSTIATALDAEVGTVWLTWTVEGTAAGSPFTVTMRNTYTGDEAIWRPANDVYASISSLYGAPGNVKITTIDMDIVVTESRIGTARVHTARTWSPAEPTFAPRRSIDVAAGDTLRVKVPIVAPDDTVVFVRTDLAIPETVTGDGRLEFRVDQADFWQSGVSMNDVVWKLSHQLASDEMRISLRMKGMERSIARRVAQPWILRGNPIDVSLQLIEAS